MLIVATSVFFYYTVWTLLMVRPSCSPTVSNVTQARRRPPIKDTAANTAFLQQPFVDHDHPLQSLFPPRVWAIRIPVILILLGCAVVGSFLGIVMIRSNRKKAVKLKKKA